MFSNACLTLLLMIGNAELKIHIPKTFYAGEVISGRCVSNVNDCSEAPFVCITVTADDNCTVNRSKETETVGKHYQKNFTIICPSGNHTVSCYTIHKTKDKLLKGSYLLLQCMHTNVYLSTYVQCTCTYLYI